MAKDFTSVARGTENTQRGPRKDISSINEEIRKQMLEESLQKRAGESGGKFKYVDLTKFPVNSDIFTFRDVEILRDSGVIPYYRIGNEIHVAAVRPNDIDVVKFVENLTQEDMQVVMHITSEDSWNYMIQKIESYQKEVKKDEINTQTSEIVEEYAKEMSSISEFASSIELSSVKKGMQQMLVGALKIGASDVHIQPQEKNALLRFRVDGILQKVSDLKIDVAKQLVQQIKYEAGMKINVENIPQDGRLKFMINDRKVDVRVSTIPTEYGDNVVMRLLDSGKKFVSFEELGFAERHLEILRDSYKMRSGMILVTGPTGSGKTTSMYSLLKEFNTSDRKVITLEDPIEYHLERIVQSQIEEDKGYTFDMALESVLRQDPDVVMVGEIRNKLVAKTALQASLTGHVVLSTLHTNSAIEAIPRLMNMEIDGFLIAPAVNVLVAQRLVRTFCPHCKKESEVSDKVRTYLETELKKIEKVSGIKREVPKTLPVAIGCAGCNHSGHKRRMVIAEVIPMDEDFKELILGGGNILDLKKLAKEKGFLSLKQDGILKVVDKQTSLMEVERVIS